MSKRILLLEDEKSVSRSMASLLRGAGHQVRVATNALEAQALATEEPPEVALVDIELPGLRGDEWALFLKETSPETRIVFVSGRAGLAGMDRYGPDVTFMHKPLDPEELLRVVEEPLTSQTP